MLLGPGILVNALFVIFGLIWCRQMFGRWRTDLAEVRSTADASAKGAIVALWAATALVLMFLANFFVALLRSAGLLHRGG